MQRWFVPHGYKELALHMLAGGVMYGACLAWAYLSGKALHVADLVATVEPMELAAAAIDTLPEDV
jgi:hypothetical protein